jgi:hypothetical protein
MNHIESKNKKMKHFPVGHGTKYNTYLHGTASNPTEKHTKDMMLDFCIKLLIAQAFSSICQK